MKYVVFILFSLALLTACGNNSSKDQKEVEQCATQFAEAFYNYDFNSAGELVTLEAARLLTFIGSNITQEDIDVLNSQKEGPAIEITDYHQTNDTLWRIRLTVSNYMEMDSIGSTMQLRDNGEAELTLVKHDGKWLVKTVRTEAPQRSGTHNRD